jgi:uncharacterized spore protein YtfJ
MTEQNRPAVLDTIREVMDNATAGKVFGTPFTQDGLTVLPVARVSGGGGGGEGTGTAEQGREGGGKGGGMGLAAKPLGVFLIKDGNVSWRPAVDVNKAILGGQLVAIAALMMMRARAKARMRMKARKRRK